MKYLAALIVMFMAATSFGQLTSTIASSRAKGMVSPAPIEISGAKSVTPLDANLAFSVSVPQLVQTFPSDFGDHVITGTITNLTDSTIHLQFHRYQLLPHNWTTSVCFGTLCLAPTADSARSLFVFGPHESEPLILHFNDTSTNMIPVADTVRTELVIQLEPGSKSDTVILHFEQMTSTTSKVGDGAQNTVSTGDLNVYPNPSYAGKEISAQVYTRDGGLGVLRVYSVSGVKLREVTLARPLQSGVNVLRINSTGLDAGAYLLSISIGTSPEISRVFQIVH
jgi:hypothetical protein